MKFQTLGEITPPPESGITRADLSNPDPWIRARAAVYFAPEYIPWQELNDEEIRAIQSAQYNLTPRQISAGNAWSDSLRQQIAQTGFNTIIVTNQEYAQAEQTGLIPQAAIDRMYAQYGRPQPRPQPVLPAQPTVQPTVQPEVIYTVTPPPLPAPPIQSGVSDADIRNFVFSVLNNASLTDAQRRAQILEAMRQYGVSDARVAQATGYTLAEIQAYLYPPAASSAPAPFSPVPVVTAPAPSSPVPAMPAPVMPAPVTGGSGSGTIFGPGTGTPLDAGFPDVNAPAPQANDSKLPLLALGVALALFS